jgi:hypothetical protein
VNSATTTTYTGGTQVILNPGFTAIAQSGTPTFIANIAPPPFYPNSGSGSSATFAITASDPNGYQNITAVQVIYNWQPTGVDGCLLNYDVVNDALTIGDLTGSLSTFGSMSLLSPSGTLGDLVNSNCQIIGSGSSLTHSGNNLTLNLQTVFRGPTGTGDPLSNPPGVPGFIGSQNIYLLTTSSDQQQPGSFQLVGTWTAYPVPHPGTYSNINPINSVNSDGTVSVQFNNENGVGYATYAQMVFGTSQTDPAACRIQYNRGTGAANHTLWLYAGDFTQVSEIGEGPVPDPGGVLQDNSTCILDIGHSYVVFDSGTTAIVNMALTFKNTGTINTYAQAFDRQNVAGAFQTSSIYIPPNNFSLTPVSAFSVQQSGTPAAFTLKVPASGTFAGQVQLTYTAPAGVSLSFEANPLTATATSSTSVQVTASSSATLGAGTITITGTSGSLTATQTIAITVLPPTPPPAVPGSFTITSQTTNVSVQQGGNTAQLTLNFAAMGSFSGSVALTANAANGVTVTLPTSVTIPATSSATVFVTAPANATVGSGNITITGTGTGASYTLTIPLTVTAAPPPPPPPVNPTFVISGPQNLNVPFITSVTTFVVTFSGLNGFPANQQIAVTVDPSATNHYLSASLSASTVYAGGSVVVSVQGSASSPTNFLCAEIDAASGSIQTAATLCIQGGESPNISFSIPQPSPTIVVPPAGTTTIVGAVSSAISNPNVTLTQYVTCPPGVSPCDGSATFGALSNGSVTITLNSGHINVGRSLYAALCGEWGGGTGASDRLRPD